MYSLWHVHQAQPTSSPLWCVRERGAEMVQWAECWIHWPVPDGAAGLIPHDGVCAVGLSERHTTTILRTGNKGVTVETLPTLACSGWWMDRWKLRDKWQRFHDELLCLGGYIVVVVHQTWSAYCMCGDTIPCCAVEYSGWEAGSSFTTFSYA